MLENLMGETIGALAVAALALAFAMHSIPKPETWFYRLPYLVINIVVVLAAGFFVAILVARMGFTKTSAFALVSVPLILATAHAAIANLIGLYRDMREAQARYKGQSTPLKQADTPQQEEMRPGII